MAVYTVIDRDDVEAFIEPFGIGPLIDYEGVAAGIENSNYFLSTDQSNHPSELRTEPVRHYVLTIFETASVEELEFFVELTTFLSLKGLPVPCPCKDADGVAIQRLQCKPALLVEKMPGQHPDNPSPRQCQTMGKTLAEVHLACLSADFKHRGSRSLDWLQQQADAMSPQLEKTDRELLDEIPRLIQQCKDHPDLPRAVIHGDLFRDNTLFQNDDLTGLIDFNSAGEGFLMYDLAVVINDWCSQPSGELDQELVSAMLTAYQQVRPFTADEKTLWPDFLSLAAARFWVSRLAVQLSAEPNQLPGGLVEHKDPHVYKTLLLQRLHDPHHID